MADRYWVGGGSSANWNATGNTNWSASSGGANNASVPGTGDNVFFDAASGAPFSATLSASQSIGTLDMLNATGTLTWAQSITLTVDGAGGQFRFGSGVTLAFSGVATTNRTATFTGAGTFTLTSAGKTLPSITVNGASAVVEQQDALALSASFGSLTLTAGTFNHNNFNFSAVRAVVSGSTARTWARGSGTITLYGVASDLFLDAGTTTNLTHTGTGAIVLAPASVFGSTFSGGGLTYNAVTYTGNGGTVTISGVNTFASMAITGPADVAFSGNQTITAAPSWVGTRAAPIVIRSNLPQTPRTLTFSSGTANCDYLIITSLSLAAGTHYAGYHSVALAGGTGWTFTAAPTYTLSGVTKDSTGAVLGSATVYPMKLTSGVWEQEAAAVTSNASTGAYSFSLRSNAATHAVIGHKADTPHKFGITDGELTPA